jgi:type IV pilus assembly protein PilM
MFNRNILAIDIGSKNIKMVVGRKQGSGVLVDKGFLLPTPLYSFNDGTIQDIDSVKGVILNKLSSESIKVKNAVCTVNSTSAITREVELPYTKNEEEIDKMVRFELEQYLPVMLSDYVIDYKKVEDFTEENIKKTRFMVIALPKIIVEGYLELLKGIKLTPLALDISSNSVSKLFVKGVNINGENYSSNKTVAVIDMGYNYLNINIISNGTSQFSRIINLGGKDIDINIANHFNISLEDAEKKKTEDCNIDISIEDSNAKKMLSEIVMNSVDSWLQEIERLFKYYITRTTGNRIDEIYIYGGTSKLKGICNYIEERLSIPVSNIDSIGTVKTTKNVNSLDLSIYLNAVGSIIRK